MRSYIALIWNDDDQCRRHSARKLKARIRQNLGDWNCGIDQPGMCLYLSSSAGRFEEVYLLSEGRGVILGRLFKREYVESDDAARERPSPVTFDESSSAQVISSAGEAIREHFWGTYLAFLSDIKTSRRWVLRDPMGMYPCQCTDLNGVSVYFSNLEDLERFEKPRLEVNRSFIMSSLLIPSPHSGDTAYREISTVLPGERVEHNRAVIRHSFYWNPLDIAAGKSRLDPFSAQVSTRRFVQSCIHAWASCFDSIFLQLSGGLDSTIVAACLASAPTKPNVICVNFHTTSDTADERVFAREVAARCGFELIEQASDEPDEIDLDPIGRAVFPISVAFRETPWLSIREELARRDVEIHIRGDGGDELFHRGDVELPDAIDHVYRHGLTSSIWQTAMNDALISGNSVWQNLKLTVLYGALKRPYNWQRRVSNLQAKDLLNTEIADEVLSNVERWHPLYRDDFRCSPAKTLQCHSTLAYTNRFFGPARGSKIQTLAPLLSQPHMEFALRAPLSVMRFGGRDRSVARAAFADVMPEKIVNRKFKSLDGVRPHDWIADRISTVRELIFDGYLVKEGILRKQRLEEVFARRSTLELSGSAELRSILAVEVWNRKQNARGSIAA